MPQEPAAASILQESWPHTANVALHVIAGTLALVLGVVQLARNKGDRLHRRIGRTFVRCIWISVATAAAGLIVFRFRAFLAVITLLVAYLAFSGVRALRIRSSGPSFVDALASCLVLATALLVLMCLPYVRFPWSPVVVYPTLSTLSVAAIYDLVRMAFPKRWFLRLGVYEHLVKMIGAFSAALSAFGGTVLTSWQPYSQVLPSALCTTISVASVVYYRRTSPRW